MVRGGYSNIFSRWAAAMDTIWIVSCPPVPLSDPPAPYRGVGDGKALIQNAILRIREIGGKSYIKPELLGDSESNYTFESF